MRVASFSQYLSPHSLVAFAALAMLSTPAFAVVVIRDGFGDADLNNNGTALEDVDVSVQGGVGSTTYIPGRLVDGSGNEPTNMEIDAALPGSDPGIRWVQMRGFSGALANDVPGAGASKPSIRIVDDTQGAMLETSNGTGGLGIQAIDSGYAMSWESRGGGSSAAGFFDRSIALGSEVGDQVKVNFDFRIWRDAPNLNGNNTNNVPNFGELRFGLFQDTDNQLGQVNPFAGRQVDSEGVPLGDQLNEFQPATWGQEEGMFEGSLTGAQGVGDDIGTNGDNGWQASVVMGASQFQGGANARIREEVQTDRILQGQDTETIAIPNNINENPFLPPVFDFVDLDFSKVYNIELVLERDLIDIDGEDMETITASLNVLDKATMELFTLTGTDDLVDANERAPGINSESWDYFAIRNASSGSGEFDFLLDNFQVEVIGSNEGLAGDFNNDGTVDAADYTTWRAGLGTTFTEADFAIWRSNYGASLAASSTATASVPEPASLVLMGFIALVFGQRQTRARA